MIDQSLFENIKAEVFKRRPVLREIAEKFGYLTLNGYVRSAWEAPKQKPDEMFFGIVGGYLARLYGKEIADSAKNQLLKKPLISTIDHLGIWGHPIFVNADLIYSLHFKKDEFAISLATESVSLNNTSSWSGSVLLHTDAGRTRRYSFFPDKLKTLPVFSAPAITNANIAGFAAHFGRGAENILNALKISVTETGFSSQACLASYNLWQKVFPSAPKFIYLPLESIILEYLKNVLPDEKHIISRIILTAAGQNLWQKYFGLEHTFMFWGIDEKGKRTVLKNLPNGQSLLKLILARKIYPSSPLCFMVLLLCGFACVGGFTQTTWLTEVKEKFFNLLEEFKREDDGHSPKDNDGHLREMPTKNFAESSLASLKMGDNIIQPSALDLLAAGKDYYGEYEKKAETLTLEESLNLAMPDIYKVVVPLKERS